jgi:UDP-N-acetylmuramoyl-tripeptide--D-alanyl-D-alanine ligase
MELSAQEVVEATGGRLVRSGPSAFRGLSTDSRVISPGCLFVALIGERFDGHDFTSHVGALGAAGVLVRAGYSGAVSPGVAVFECDDTLVALGRLARFHRRRFRIPVGAVTGSNGKTTTKELVAGILETRGPALKTHGNLNNEIGVPLTLFRLEPAHQSAVVEMGMNHSGEIARMTAIAEPDAGLVTVVQAAHIEGVGSIEGVANAKAELFTGLTANATAVVNLDDPRIAARAHGLAAKVMTFGRAAAAEVRLLESVPDGFSGQRLRISARSEVCDVSLALVGAHNAHNATAAFALSMAMGFSPQVCAQGLSKATAHSRRLQVLKTNTLTVIDDCYNANPSSMAAALATLFSLAAGQRAVAVLGDMLELGSLEAEAHRELGVAARQAGVVAFFGPRSQSAFAQATAGQQTAHFVDMEPLLVWLKAQLRPGDVVLVKGSRGMKLERVVNVLTGGSGGEH